MGIHLYGHDWVGTSSNSLTWEGAQQLITTYSATPQWRASGGWRLPIAEPWFAYIDSQGRRHEVWYADGDSVAARLGLVQRYGLGGVAVWRLGGEDPASWSAVAEMVATSDEPE